MTEMYGDGSGHIKLRDSDRVLEDEERDIRGWPALDEAGNEVGRVEDLLLNTDTEFVDAIALDDGRSYPIGGIEIGDEAVYLLDAGVAGEVAEDLKIQRSEEELRAGTREREAGSMRVRKKVVTDHERLEVPVSREEVEVERVPVDRETSEQEIGDDEVRVPLTEEEVVVEKRPVAKEEIRIRKDAVEDTEVVEEDIRREEVDIDDESEQRLNR